MLNSKQLNSLPWKGKKAKNNHLAVDRPLYPVSSSIINRRHFKTANISQSEKPQLTKDLEKTNYKTNQFYLQTVTLSHNEK